MLIKWYYIVTSKKETVVKNAEKYREILGNPTVKARAYAPHPVEVSATKSKNGEKWFKKTKGGMRNE